MIARFFAAVLLAFVGITAVPLAPAPFSAAARATDLPGQFDHWLFVLSWSPSYCEAESDGGNPEQCASGRPYGFVVHGLWPQYARGWPEYCASADRRLAPAFVDEVFPLMPSRGLIRHQWEKHGTCSGLSPEAYFDRVREARRLIRVPDDLQRLYIDSMVSPAVIERMFRGINPGMPANAISVTCDRRRLREVRICLDRDFGYRACPAMESRACKSDWIRMPPVRPVPWRVPW
jgi:ribonuclease T2